MKQVRVALTLLGLIAPIFFLALNWTSIPAVVPTHFGIGGIADGFGGRNTLWLLPTIACSLAIALTIVMRFPRVFNLPIPRSDPRRPQVEAIAIEMIEWMRLEIAWLFAYLVWTSVQVAWHLRSGLAANFTGAIALLIVITCGIFVARMYKI